MPEPELCRYCNDPLDDGRAFQTDLEGNGAHLDCLPTPELEDEPDDVY